MECNGFKNYATFTVASLIDNDRDLKPQYTARAARMLEKYGTVDRAVLPLADSIKQDTAGAFMARMPMVNFGTVGMMGHAIVGNAFETVDYVTIARNMLEECE